MAQAVPNPPTDRKRVKVYELRNNDWFDRGTGFCVATLGDGEREEPRITVEAEDPPERLLLETRICKEDGFQKQQDTLIVWTEPVSSVDMALSFQEAEGCAAIWKFVNSVQQHLLANGGPDDALDDELALDSFQNNISLPTPELGNLKEVEDQMRSLGNTQGGREALAKFIISDEYIPKLIPLVEMAEDLESLPDLHRLCNIMKTLILLNDTAIIEYAMTDDMILGVVGALEYDPDFPSHKANHRQWLSDQSRYKEVVRIDDGLIRKKIHHTYRLQYLKDVVLARILDDPTFSILNSLIFFNQVDIVQHLQTNAVFLKELFGVFGPQNVDQKRRKDAVLFIQQCCAIAKNLQAPARQQLYNNFLGHGLLGVINYALRHNDVGVRVGATDVLVSMIDHDPQMIRQTIFRQINEKQIPLTDSLIDLLLVEVDLGVTAQIADAIKVLLDPGPQVNPLDLAKNGNEYAARMRPQADPQQELFLVNFYEDSAKRLFKPLMDLKGRKDMNFTVQQVSLFVHLIEILCFFIRQHQHRSKYFVLAENLGQRVAQLLSCPEKHLKLTALKFFRNLVGLQDEFYNQQMMQEHLFEPILNIVYETMPRDNLLNSACLELFEYVRRENVKMLVKHLVENYRDKIKDVTYVDTFTHLILRYDQTQGYSASMDQSTASTDELSTDRSQKGDGRRWQGMKDLDATEEEYFNTSDDEDDMAVKSPSNRATMNGASPLSKPLVDYPSDEEEATETGLPAGILADRPDGNKDGMSDEAVTTPPPERLSEKRRREEDDEDELMKLSLQQSKRRSSSSSASSIGSSSVSVIRRRKSFSTGRESSATPKKIAISLAPAIKTGGDGGSGGEGER
ncbi:MAG: Platinum sensitivity protein [Claussenomyces sp. TS43310]|nr:MAG: Platinum sensitivity protein [Claussenomyces sp. TS43310]